MHDRYFNRIKLFWAAEAHKKFMEKRNKKEEKEILEMAKNIPMVVFQTLVALGVTVALLTALLYTALWLS